MHVFLFSDLNRKMDNTTTRVFTMTAFAVLQNYKHELFAVFLLLYLLPLILNSLLIMVIHRNKELHQPMNMFTCLLSINEIYGTTALLPAIMSTLLSKTHEMPVRWCMTQVFCLHTYASAEFCVLAVMGYDRYIAICYPLHYHSIMSCSKISRLVAFAVLYPNIVFGCYYSLTLKLRFCGKTIPKLYCVNMELVKNSCSYEPYISILGLILILLLIIPQLLMIVFSYAKIATVCLKLTRESKRNALKTCIPHLLSLLNYTIGSFFEIIQSRFNMSHVAVEARIFLSLYFVIFPSITNPVLYGLGTQIIRVHIVKLLIKHKIWPSKIAKGVFAAWMQPNIFLTAVTLICITFVSVTTRSKTCYFLCSSFFPSQSCSIWVVTHTGLQVTYTFLHLFIRLFVFNCAHIDLVLSSFGSNLKN